jgi:integrase
MAYAEKKILKGGKVVYYAVYTGPDGRRRTAGSFTNKRDAQKAADAQESTIRDGAWVDPTNTKTTFKEYVDSYYWPTTVHLEVSTRTAYRYYLDKHFLPEFGHRQLRLINPSLVQGWVNEASAGGLSARSVVKYHALLHRIFERAVIDRVVPINPCAHTQLPKVVATPKRIITTEQFDAILGKVPARYRTMVLLAIETGLRWGELIALRPCDLDFTSRIITVRRVIVEVAKKNSPTGQRTFVKDYPKDDEQRRVSIDKTTITLLREHMLAYNIRDTTCSSHPPSGPHCRGTTSARNTGCPQSKPRRSTRKSRSITCAPRTPRGYSPAAPTSSSCKNDSATVASPPPSNTPAPSPTPANEPSPPSAASDTAKTPTHDKCAASLQL